MPVVNGHYEIDAEAYTKMFVSRTRQGRIKPAICINANSGLVAEINQGFVVGQPQAIVPVLSRRIQS